MKYQVRLPVCSVAIFAFKSATISWSHVFGTATAAFYCYNFLTQPADGSVGSIWYAIAAVRDAASIFRAFSSRYALAYPFLRPFQRHHRIVLQQDPMRSSSYHLLLISHQLLALLRFQCRKLPLIIEAKVHHRPFRQHHHQIRLQYNSFLVHIPN